MRSFLSATWSTVETKFNLGVRRKGFFVISDDDGPVLLGPALGYIIATERFVAKGMSPSIGGVVGEGSQAQNAYSFRSWDSADERENKNRRCEHSA